MMGEEADEGEENREATPMRVLAGLNRWHAVRFLMWSSVARWTSAALVQGVGEDGRDADIGQRHRCARAGA